VARLFGDFYKPKALSRPLKALRRTARALGAVRDLDVALAKLDRFAAAAEAEGGGFTAADFQDLAAEWRVERRQAYRELLAWLDGDAYRDFVAGFAALCRNPGAGALRFETEPGEPPRPHQVRHVLPSAILLNFEQVRAYEPLFEAGEVPLETLHMLRIDCKALRYSLEPVEHLLGDEGAAMVQRLKGLQDLLGDLNDASVARLRLETLSQGAPALPGLDAYLAHQLAVAAELAPRVPDAWRTFVGPKNRQRLAAALARL
jgi:CHAD domain-containing protein